MGTVWNSWQTQWSGGVSSNSERRSEIRYRDGRTMGFGREAGMKRISEVIERTTTTTRTNLKRTGVRTTVVESVEEESLYAMRRSL